MTHAPAPSLALAPRPALAAKLAVAAVFAAALTPAPALASTPPVVGPAPAFTPPTPEVRELANGARAWVLPQSGVPLVHVIARIATGSLNEAAPEAGLALLTARTVDEGGSGDKSREAVLAAFDALGVELSVEVSDSSTLFSLTVLASELEPAVRLLAEVIAAPRFDAGAFASVKARQLAELASALDAPREVASLQLRRSLYGDSPAGHGALGTATTVAALALDDVRRFHERHYGPRAVTFVIVGATTPDVAARLLEAGAPSRWTAAAAPAPQSITEGPPPEWRGVDRPGLPQTILLVGRRGPLAGAPILPALELATIALGGSFTSRLNQNLREKRGFTYGVKAGVFAGASTGWLLATCAVKSAVSAPALEELLREFAALSTLNSDELEKAKAQQRQAHLDAFSTGASAAGAVADVVDRGLAPDTLAQERRALEGVTLTAAQEASKHFDPSAFSVIVVGDRSGLAPSLAKLAGARPVRWVAPAEL